MKFPSLAVAAILLSSGAAQAASISVSSFSVGNYATQFGLLGPTVVEDFEGFVEGNVNGLPTAVGTFTTLGGTGSGGTVTDADPGFPLGNDGTQLAIRDGNVFGRTSTTSILSGNASDDKFLDSNDTLGIKWLVDIGSMFNRLIFTLTDAADTGATITISTADATPVFFKSQGNGNRKLIVVDFGGAVSSAHITLANTDANGDPKLNDGFSIDDIAVSVVPLPAPALMLIGGLAGLAAFRRKRAAA
jgi:hypothetical protein